jgi:hypothetical protein
VRSMPLMTSLVVEAAPKPELIGNCRVDIRGLTGLGYSKSL